MAVSSGKDSVTELLAGADDYFNKEVGTILYKRLINSIIRLVSAREHRIKQEEMERALHRAEERAKAFIESLEDMVYCQALDGRRTLLNDANAEITGYGREEWEANPGLWREIIHPDDLRELEKYFSKQPGCAAKYSIEYRLRRKDGQWRWIRSRMIGMRDVSGRHIGYNCIDRDVTKEKNAEEKVQRQIEFLHNVLSSLTHPFYVIDAQDYTIKTANEAARLGPLSDRTKCYELTHRSSEPCSSEECQCPLDIVKKNKKPSKVEHIHYDNEGNARYLEIHGYPIFDRKGEVIQLIEYALDVTEEKLLKEELRKRRSDLESTSLKPDSLSRSITQQFHKLTQQLKKLHQSLAVASVEKLKPQIADNIKDISDSSRQLEHILEELQKISRDEIEEDFSRSG